MFSFNYWDNFLSFIFLSFDSVKYTYLYTENSTCDQRCTIQAIADNVTGHVVELLKKKGMCGNTIFVVSAELLLLRVSVHIAYTFTHHCAYTSTTTCPCGCCRVDAVASK